MINIEPFKKYNKKEISNFLEFSDNQLKFAEQQKLIVFFDGYMYGLYFFQFLKTNTKQLEQIKEIKL